MPKTVVLDELTVVVRVPAGLPDRAAHAARRAVTGKAFVAWVQECVRAAARAHPDLARVRLTVVR